MKQGALGLLFPVSHVFLFADIVYFIRKQFCSDLIP